MADWSLPDVDEGYADVIDEINARDDDAVRMNDTRVADATSLPDHAKRWNNTLAVFQNWFSSAWSALVLAIAGGGTGATSAAGARTNLGVYSTTEVDNAIDGDVATHNANTFTAHGAVIAATPFKIIVRDSAGRAAVATPSASGDIATKGYVDGIASSANYNPTLTAVANIGSLQLLGGKYMKIGDSVHVTAYFYGIPSGANLLVRIGISLPFAVNIVQALDVIGVITGYQTGSPNIAGGVIGDATNDRAEAKFVSTIGGGQYFHVSFIAKAV